MKQKLLTTFVLGLMSLLTTQVRAEGLNDGINYVFNDNGTATVVSGNYSGNVTIPSSITVSSEGLQSTNWTVQSGEWTETTQDNAFNNEKYTCKSPGDSKSTVIRCTFRTTGNIAFYCVSDGEYGWDYLTMGDIDTQCTRKTYLHTFKDKVHKGSIFIYTPADSEEHFVEFCYSKDEKYSESTDNATIYAITQQEFAVTAIEGRAFKECSGLTSVTIPNSVTEIGYEAFLGCSNLASVVWGVNVQSVGSSSFSGCNSLYKLILLPNTVPSGLSFNDLSGRITYVANDNYSSNRFGTVRKLDFLSSMFEVDGVRYVPLSPSERTCIAIDCTYSPEDKNIIIGDHVNYRGIDMNVNEICPRILYNNKSVESIDFSVSTDIPEYFAYGCSNVKSISLSNTGCIGESAFRGCSGLKSINIPEHIKEIKESTFENCTSLGEIILPSGLELIGNDAFRNAGLLSVSIPSSVTEISNGAFYYCKSLESFIAENGEQDLSIGYSGWYDDNMFSYSPLKSVKIGRNLVYNTGSSYGYSPFYRNTTLESVELTQYPKEVTENEFYGCTLLKNVTIGDGVTKMGNYAFSGCTALESFSFGSSVQSIGAEAFSDCTAMTKLYAEPMVPPTCGTQALDDINKWDCILYVQEDAIDDYRNADQWKEFFFMEAGDFNAGIDVPMVTFKKDDTFTVYDLNGRLRLKNADHTEVLSLPAGIYVVNGKKVIIR